MDHAQLAGWMTPKETDTSPPREPDGRLKWDRQTRTEGTPGSYKMDLADQVGLTGWTTPEARPTGSNPEDFLKRKERPGTGAITDLGAQAQLAGWATPAAQEFEPQDIQRTMERRQECLKKQVNGNGFGLTLGVMAQLSAPGPTTGSPTAPTASRGVLDAAFSRWLMGFPETWCRLSPGWWSWALTQRLLAGYSPSPGEIASAVSEATATPSSQK